MMQAMLRERVAEALAQHRPGFSLPQALYVDDDMHRADLEAVFETDWLFACNVAEIKQPGDYITLEIGPNSVVVLRDRDGQVRAFHNTCRHRGSRICLEEKGRANRLGCPYHQWVYELAVLTTNGSTNSTANSSTPARCRRASTSRSII